MTPQDQTTLVLVSHGIQGIFNETDTAGGILLAIAFILLGTAKALGLVSLIGISVISIRQDNPNDYAFVILVTILPVLLGWKLYSSVAVHIATLGNTAGNARPRARGNLPRRRGACTR